MDPIDRLGEEIARRELLADPQSGAGIIFGTARVPALGVVVTVNVDPELDDRDDLDVATLTAGIERLLGLSAEQWARVRDEIALEIEEAVGDQPVREETDLRADLTLRSTVVFHDAFLLSFAAPNQFPDSWIRVQLDTELELDGVVVDPKDDDPEAVEFGSLDDLLDHLSAAGDGNAQRAAGSGE
ncbi:cytochrome C5 [Nocardia sp. NPDC057668]|uniref:cytochrome C5 n=1 Tax=Nocardia sp. NPDC057668 TaxID=3346202 RepID=UPI00366C5A5F